MSTYLALSIILFLIAILTGIKKGYKTSYALIDTLFIFLYLMLTISYFIADYFTKKGITEAVVFTLQTGLSGAGIGEYKNLIFASMSFLFVSLLLSYLYYKRIKKHITLNPIFHFMHILIFAIAYMLHPFILDSYKLYSKIYFQQSHDFYKYYKNQDFTDSQSNEYNLVYIYAESLEKTYLDESLFPGLMPNLNQLKTKNTQFTNINQVASTGWTIGGMVASQCGIPLFTTSQGNSMSGSDQFLGNADCMGDILKSAGYHTIFMQGALLSFSGKGTFYRSHKFDEIYGFNELANKQQSYKNGWGLYDDTLLPLVYKKFEKMSKSNKKFALFMLTLDTHHPKGMTSKSCIDMPYKDGKNSILNAVHCSDLLISDFIKKIRQSKFSNKTIIVLTSDHLAMGNTATYLLMKRKRKDLFMIFDPQDIHKSINKAGSVLDIGTTVLHKLGIDTNIGLGRNLYAANSLSSTIGDFNRKLWSWRKEVLRLWNFADLSSFYTVDPVHKNITFDNRSYSYPALIKIDKHNQIIPYFEFDDPITYEQPTTLPEYISTFHPMQKFIWVDRCQRINIVFDKNMTSNYCIAQGSLSGEVYLQELSNQPITIQTNKLDKKQAHNIALYYKRLKKLTPGD